MELGEQIATLREEQALTQAELAEAARISPSTLSQIESGRVPSPHVGTVRKIARALGVEPAELRRAKEPVPLAEAPKEAGPEDEETPRRLLIDAEVLANMAELWNALLSRGLYDRDTLGQMYMAGGLLAMGHEANIAEYRGSLPPNLLKQLEAAEEQFIAVDGQILEMLEKTRRGHDAPADELAAKREAQRQEIRGGRHARHG